MHRKKTIKGKREKWRSSSWFAQSIRKAVQNHQPRPEFAMVRKVRFFISTDLQFVTTSS
jgi:hypothetical protein